MSGLALLGVLLVLYAVVVVVVAIKQPSPIWNTVKGRTLIKLFGDKGTVVVFYIVAAAALITGILLMIR